MENKAIEENPAADVSGQADRLVMHTTGPWKWDGDPVNHDRNEEAPWLVNEDYSAVITGEIKVYNYADAKLIAAAPDLLHACRQVMRCFGASDNWRGETRKALAIVEKALMRIKA